MFKKSRMYHRSMTVTAFVFNNNKLIMKLPRDTLVKREPFNRAC